MDVISKLNRYVLSYLFKSGEVSFDLLREHIESKYKIYFTAATLLKSLEHLSSIDLISCYDKSGVRMVILRKNRKDLSFFV